MRYYFANERNVIFAEDFDEDKCYPESTFQEYMQEHSLTEIEVCLAVKDTVYTDYFWCGIAQEFGEKGQGTCGKNCKDYKPRNGKSGRCCHYGFTYERGEELILKRKDKR